MNPKYAFLGLVIAALPFALMQTVYADSVSVNFENPPYTLGVINSQDGWMSTGAAGSGCALYDQKVDSSLGFTGFGSQSLRISDAVTSGCFSDQVFAKPLTDSVGESSATADGWPVGAKQTRFVMQFQIASAVPGAQQPGLHLSVSPDRGDGSRMSYLRFEDGVGGLNVFFDDVQGESNPANFVDTQVGTDLDRTVPHTIKLVMDVVDGPSNDVVKVSIDGVLVHTGTSWENYYRFDSEAATEQSPRIVRTVLFRSSGTSVPADLNHGFLVDNLQVESLTPVMPSVPAITFPTNGASVTVSALTHVDWTDSTGTFSPFTYQYESYTDVGYTALAYSSGWLTSSEIPTLGTPVGTYYLRVRTKDANGNISEWSNGASSPYMVVVVADIVLVGPPTNKDACKKDGWKLFNNPVFKNQGACVSYVEHHLQKDDHDSHTQDSEESSRKH